MPFDNARSVGLERLDLPDRGGILAAVARFDSAHPFLLFRKPALPDIRSRAAGSPKLQARLEKALTDRRAPVAGDPRAAVKRRARALITTAFLAMTGEERASTAALAASRRTLAELAVATSWKERPVIRSFLDCAEIAVAVALAYDWLYAELPAAERSAIEQAILRNVLVPARAAYEDPSLLWPKRRDNCSLVSNSGILVAALAVAPRYAELSADLVGRSVASASNVFSGMAPDGAWREGLSYWSLAMRYAVLMVAALESALGTSFGLAERPGFGETGDFALHAVGPSGAAFNFGDSQERYDPSPLAWLAHRFGRAVDGWLLGDSDGWHLPFATIWPGGAAASPSALGLPAGKIFHSGDLACFRNTWSSAPAARPVYLAIKGGNVPARLGRRPPPPEEITLHAQADAGTFIIDGARHRWVLDMGSDDYDLPGYFDHGVDGRSGRRWRYYRSQAAGHNTLTIDGCDQVPNAPAPIIGSCAEGECKWAVLDLSAAYGQPPGAVRRGAALLGRQIVIQDEIDPAIDGTIVWTAHTAAEPTLLRGSLARFRQGDDRLVARILEPAGARFELSPPPPPVSFAPDDARRLHGGPLGEGARVCELPRRADHGDARAAGGPIRRLQIVLPAGARRLTVLLLPDCDENEIGLPVAPLDHWLARRPVRLTGVPRRGCRARGLRPAHLPLAVRYTKSRVRYYRQSEQANRDHA